MRNKKTSRSLALIVSGEIGELQCTLELLLRHYGERIRGDLQELQQAVQTSPAQSAKATKIKTHDLRDMLMLIRGLEVRPTKGKRRDLKRLESLVEDLQGFVRDWKAM